MSNGKLSLREKIAYALGDASANIAWRGICAFLLIYYTDVFGLDPLAVGTLFFVVRLQDGISDVAMGAVCDATKSKYGKFRPWILWTAIPLAVVGLKSPVMLSILMKYGFPSTKRNVTGEPLYAFVSTRRPVSSVPS